MFYVKCLSKTFKYVKIICSWEAVSILAIVEKLFNPERIVKKEHRTENELPQTRDALKTFIKVAWPAVLECILVSLISLVDNVMVGTLGHEAIASVGLTNQPRFIVLALFMSLNVGVTAVVSRRRGENNRESANKTLRQAMLISAVGSVLISAVAIYFARPLLNFAGAEPDTIEGAVTYFTIIIGGIFFNVMSLCINAAQRGCGNTRISMTTNIIANVVNVIFNYLLIGGNLGFPKLGIAGAAIATTLGYAVAFVIALISVTKKDRFLYVSFKESFLPDRQNLSALLKVGSSAAVEQVFMRIGFFAFAIIVAKLGTIEMSTHQICTSILNVSFAFGDGLAIAASALVGQSLGRKRHDLAVMYGHMAQRMGLIIGGILFVLFTVFRSYLIMMFNMDAKIIELGSAVLIILAAMCPLQISQVIFSNCLRVSGDTKYVAMVSLVSVTFIRTCFALFLCYTLKLGLIGAWLGFFIDQSIRLALNATRFATGKWMKMRL